MWSALGAGEKPPRGISMSGGGPRNPSASLLQAGPGGAPPAPSASLLACPCQPVSRRGKCALLFVVSAFGRSSV